MLRLIIDQNYYFTLTRQKTKNTLLITKLEKIHQRAHNHMQADINAHKLIKNKNNENRAVTITHTNTINIQEIVVTSSISLQINMHKTYSTKRRCG